MTKEQYINPECEKFTISGVDYYVHPKMAPFGVSVDAEFINTRTKKFLKLSVQQKRRTLAFTFVPNPNNYNYAGPKFGEDESISIANTEWSRSSHKNVRSVGLYIGDSTHPVQLFKCLTDAARFVVKTTPYDDVFSKSGHSIVTALQSKGLLISSCGTYQLLAAA